jgi:hypothetical protein
VLNANNYYKKQKLAIKKAQKYNETNKILKNPKKKRTMTTKIENIKRLVYGVLLSVLLLQLFIMAVAPFAAHVGYPLVVAVSSGVTTTIYPGPVLIVAAMAAGFAVALTTPRRYYGIWVVIVIIPVTLLFATLAAMTVCHFCKVFICDPYPVASCGEVDFLYAKIICACNIP